MSKQVQDWITEVSNPKRRTPLGWDHIDTLVRGPAAGEVFTVIARSHVGKGEPLSSEVLTPLGPRKMGDLSVGDFVVGASGLPTQVAGVTPLGVRQVFRVSLSDGSFARVTEDHLWTVTTVGGWTETLDTKALATRAHRKLRLPLTQPVTFSTPPPRLPSYLVGAMLGDGSFRGGLSFTSADQPVIDRVRLEAESIGDSLSDRKAKYAFGVTGNHMRQHVTEWGMFNHYSYEKWIPDEYLFGRWQDRLDLLRGLLDTDGYVNNNGKAMFTSSAPRLADGVRWLVESLGGTVTQTLKKIEGYRDAHTMVLRIPEGLNPFWLQRKADLITPPRTHRPARYVVAVEEDGREEAQCISVAAWDGLYQTGNFIVTHNSAIATNVMANNSDAHIIFFSLEMPTHQVLHRLAAHVFDFPASDLELAEMALSLPDFVSELPERLPYQVVVDDSGLSLEEMSVYLDDYSTFYGQRPSLAIIDYMEEVASSEGEGVEATRKVASNIKRWAKSEKIGVLVLHQTNRLFKQYLPPDEDSARSAGYTEADVVLGLWRPGWDPKLSPELRIQREHWIGVNVLKNRVRGIKHDGLLFRLDPAMRMVHVPQYEVGWEQDLATVLGL